MYPKVQKYCLMSVKGCWTDFHIGKFEIKKYYQKSRSYTLSPEWKT